jgi:hypothetical protein
VLLEIGIVRLCFIILGVILGGALLLEAILRFVFGFGSPLIYQADSDIGYFLAPNQKIRRFSNRIEINQYSMRSAEIATDRPANTLRILLIGDSIANGAWWTDQSRIISSLIEQQLTPTLSSAVEVLNASANSWGPRNQLAYLQRFGTFQSQVILVLMNTDDLFSAAPSSAMVGRDSNYPDRSPGLALLELYDKNIRRYPPLPTIPEEDKDRVGTNLKALDAIQAIARNHQAQLILAITPLSREANQEGRDYEAKAKQRLENFAKSRQIPYLDFLPTFQNITPPNSLYRDNIHLSPPGNALVSQNLAHAVIEVLRR